VPLVRAINPVGRRTDDRRRHFRAPVSMAVRCRAARDERRQEPQTVRAVDISRGGIRIDAPAWVQRDDVLEVDVGPLALEGVVVGLSRGDRDDTRQAHVVFVGLTPRLLRQLDRLVSHRYVPA
jgi:c-di-GMP-binding flagellar brake protein YcgR